MHLVVRLNKLVQLFLDGVSKELEWNLPADLAPVKLANHEHLTSCLFPHLTALPNVSGQLTELTFTQVRSVLVSHGQMQER